MSANEPNAYLVTYVTLNGGLYPKGTDRHTLVITKLHEMPINDGIFVRSIDPIYIEYFPELDRPCHQKVKFRIQKRNIRRKQKDDLR